MIISSALTLNTDKKRQQRLENPPESQGNHWDQKVSNIAL